MTVFMTTFLLIICDILIGIAASAVFLLVGYLQEYS